MLFFINRKKTMRTALQLLAVFIVFSFAVPIVSSQPAAAEGFFDKLFKKLRKKKKKKKVVAPRVKRKKKKARKKKSKKKTVIPVVQKLEDAKKILIVGDFYAGALGKGLTKRLAKNPSLVVLSKHNSTSGFVRDDHYDWPTKLPELIEKVKPDFLVVMLGVNDRQTMRIGDKSYKLRTPEWDEAYKTKVKGFVDVVKGTKLPFVWLGLPPVRSAKGSADLLFFNETIRNALGADGFTNVASPYVDIWDGFADEAGGYVQTGPNVSGQLVRLRANDGINFSKGGKDKLAFYAENAIRKILPEGFSLQGEQPSKAVIAAPKIIIDPRITGRTDVILLSEPNFGTDKLIGRKEDFQAFNAKSSAQDAFIAAGGVVVGDTKAPKPEGLYEPKTSTLKRADPFKAR